jgi:hypothetical protein
MVACALAAGALAAVACIADLPADAPDAASGTDAEIVADDGAETVDGGVGIAEEGGNANSGNGCGDGIIDLDAGQQCNPLADAANPSTASECTARCKMKCSGYVWPKNNHCYWVQATNATTFYPAAIQGCQNASSGGHVVTFASEEEFTAVENALFPDAAVQAKANPYWIGLQMIPTTIAEYAAVQSLPEPGWSPRCPGCYAHTPDPKVALPRHIDPNDSGLSDQPCVVAYPDPGVPSWRQHPCANAPGDGGAKTQLVCEREPLGKQFAPCADAGGGALCIDLVVTQGRKRYVIDPAVALTADAAAGACASMGGRLVVLESRDEREQLWFQLQQISQQLQRVWIGLALSESEAGTDDASADAEASAPMWLWDNSTPVDAQSPWGMGQPVLSSATTRAYLRANADSVDNTLARNDESKPMLPFVCELRVGSP